MALVDRRVAGGRIGRLHHRPPREGTVASVAEVPAAPASVTAADAGAARMQAPRAAQAASTLGTQWGEGRASLTQVVRASRLAPDRPRDVGQLRYSDEDSIRRALGRSAER